MKNYIYPFVLALLITACGSSVSVTSDSDKTADFSKYKTFTYYGWADKSDQLLTQFDKDRIESSFQNEFANRGWTANQTDGDAIVSLYIVVDQKTSFNSYTDHYNTGMYGGMYQASRVKRCIRFGCAERRNTKLSVVKINPFR